MGKLVRGTDIAEKIIVALVHCFFSVKQIATSRLYSLLIDWSISSLFAEERNDNKQFLSEEQQKRG